MNTDSLKAPLTVPKMDLHQILTADILQGIENIDRSNAEEATKRQAHKIHEANRKLQ